MATPLTAAGAGLARAQLEILKPRVPDPLIPLRFNPAEYQVQKANNFAEIAIPGLGSPPIQFIRGGAEKLAFDALADTSDTLEDVRKKYVDKLRALLDVDSQLHAPPIVRFVWDTQVFVGVLESLNVTYQLFTPEGIPLRAKLGISLKEYRPAALQVNEAKLSSPNVEKSYTVRRGDTLSAIAADAYRDPSRWRDIARANAITDPRTIQPGRVLTLPALRQ
jgi:nucleoid-associated protein YgaU